MLTPPSYEIIAPAYYYQAVHIKGSDLAPYEEAIFSLKAKVYAGFPYFWEANEPQEQLCFFNYMDFCKENPFCHVTCLFDQEKLIGVAIGMPLMTAESRFQKPFIEDDREWHLANMYFLADLFLDPLYQHQGLGLKLMLSAYSIIPPSFTTLVFTDLDSHATQEPPPQWRSMAPFWERLGFQKTSLHLPSEWTDSKAKVPLIYWIGERMELENF